MTESTSVWLVMAAEIADFERVTGWQHLETAVRALE
jgi:hypothetical protein